MQLGPRAAAALEEQYRGEPLPGARLHRLLPRRTRDALDASKLTGYARKAFGEAGIAKPFRPWPASDTPR